MNVRIKISGNDFNKNIWRYYAFTFFVNLHFFGAVLVPFFTDWGGITKGQTQLLQSWFVLWIFILEIPTGVIADYLGRKYSLTLGAFTVAIAALVYGSIPRFEIFLLAEFIFAVAFALMSGANEALLYDALKESGREKESKKIFGRAHSINLLGIMIAAPIGSVIASRFGLNFPMLFTAIPSLMAAILIWFIREPEVYDKTSERKRYFDIAKKGFLFFYNHRALRLLALDAIAVSSAAYFVIWLYQPLLQSAGVPIFYFGFIHFLLVATEILISSNFVRLEKLFGSGKAYLSFAAVSTGVAFIIVALFPNLVTISFFIIFAGGFGLTRRQLMNIYMNRFIPSRQRATVLSSISMFNRLALVFLNPLVGFAADYSLSLALFGVGLLPLAVFFFSPLEKEMLEDTEIIK